MKHWLAYCISAFIHLRVNFAELELGDMRSDCDRISFIFSSNTLCTLALRNQHGHGGGTSQVIFFAAARYDHEPLDRGHWIMWITRGESRISEARTPGGNSGDICKRMVRAYVFEIIDKYNK
jgi:hypothetical protein